MAFQSSVTLAEEELSCPICFEDFSQYDEDRYPKLLNCLHTFCLRCIKITMNKDKSIMCSICRQCHCISRFDDLLDNYVIFDYLDNEQLKADQKLALRLSLNPDDSDEVVDGEKDEPSWHSHVLEEKKENPMSEHNYVQSQSSELTSPQVVRRAPSPQAQASIESITNHVSEHNYVHSVPIVQSQSYSQSPSSIQRPYSSQSESSSDSDSSEARVSFQPSVNDTRQFSLSMMVPGQKVGLIIGRYGMTIREIECHTRANLVFIQDDCGYKPQKELKITGNAKEIYLTQAIIERIIDGHFPDDAIRLARIEDVIENEQLQYNNAQVDTNDVQPENRSEQTQNRNNAENDVEDNDEEHVQYLEYSPEVTDEEDDEEDYDDEEEYEDEEEYDDEEEYESEQEPEQNETRRTSEAPQEDPFKLLGELVTALFREYRNHHDRQQQQNTT